jgi:CheY-like chemotaxis protein
MPDTVLIVDDCASLATPLEIALSHLPDVRILTLSSVMDALKILSDARYHVTAVVTDLNLPLMNGLELLDRIRSHQQYSRIPVVVVTGDSNPLTRTQAIQRGASAYFPKPYSPATIRQELERLLNVS